MKKIILPGLLAGLAALISSAILSLIFTHVPAIAADYANPALIRPFSDPLMSVFFLYPFILGIALAWAWNKSKSLFLGTTAARGTKFGLSVWLISTIPGMFVSYTCFPISILTVLSWTVDGLAASIIIGMIVARMNR